MELTSVSLLGAAQTSASSKTIYLSSTTTAGTQFSSTVTVPSTLQAATVSQLWVWDTGEQLVWDSGDLIGW